MAKKKAREFKVNYKGLVREIKKTLRELKKIKGKVAEGEQKDIDLQIQYLDYLAAECKGKGKMTKAYAPKMTRCAAPTPKMTGCAPAPTPKMTGCEPPEQK